MEQNVRDTRSKTNTFDELVLFSSARSAGKKVEFQGQLYTVQELTDGASEHFDYILMSAGGSTSEHFAPLFEAGAIVIDNSSQWRMAEDVDLIVPEVNEPQLHVVLLLIQIALQFNQLYLLKFYKMHMV